jgi:predicted transcriptional regulator
MVVSKEIIPLEDVKKEVLEFCVEPQNQKTILEHIQVPVSGENYKRYVGVLLRQRFIKSDQERNRNSVKQNYVITQKGLNYLKAIS